MTFFSTCWKFLTIFLILTLSSAVAEQQLKLGVIAPLSGSAANMGEGIRNSLSLLKSQELIFKYEDDQCDPNKALSAYYKLRGEEVKLWYVACSGSIMALAPLVKKDGGLLLTAYAGSASIRDTGVEVIRFNPDSVSIAEVMISYIRKYGYKSVALFYEEQSYSSSLAGLLQQALDQKVQIAMSYQINQASYKTELQKIKFSGADLLVLIPVSDQAVDLIYKQLRELQVKIPILGEVNLCDYKVTPALYDLHGQCWQAKLATKGYQHFLRKYQETYKKSPEYPFYDALTFDIATVLTKFIREGSAHVTVADIRRKILSGVSGEIADYSFSESGEVIGTDYLVLKNFGAGS